MRKLLVIFLLLISSFGFGQQVNAPDPKSFVKSTNGQDASGFSLSGFNSGDVLLCAIGLPQAPSGTTFYMTTTTGLTASTGYTMSGNKSRLAFTGTMANINAALATLKVNTTATNGVLQISVSATVNPTGYYYLPTNGHFYKPMTWPAGSSYQGNNVTPYNNLKTLCTQQTFKGQNGYLMTITSADEDNFVYLNVPGNNIIFALTDNAQEGRFVIDAGPENGTVIKTQNGSGGNVAGQYNNWAGGEPNNWGPGENYVVTKWSGGSQWNDYGPAATAFPGGISGYVIEFGTWTNPDDQTFTNFYSNSVNHTNGETFRAQYTFNFLNLSANTFSVRTKSLANNQWTPFSNNYYSLNGTGKVDLTSYTDTNKVANGYKALITAGQVEWSYSNPNASWLNGNSRLLIDMRTFGSVAPSSINKVQILDCYDSTLTYNSNDGTWAIYTVPSPLTKVTNGTSTFNSYIRNVNNWNTDYAFKSNVNFTANNELKKQGIQFKAPITDTLNAMLDRIVTVSDVYLAFKELADNGGIFGGGGASQFTSGIQYMNADIDENDVFDERDCFRLLQHLTGQKSLLDTVQLSSFMQILPTATYNSVTKTNWVSQDSWTSDEYLNYTLGNTTGLNAYTFNIFWKGDVNMSHSPAQVGAVGAANGVQSFSAGVAKMATSSTNPTAYIISELKGDSLYVSIKFNPNSTDISGTQFKLNYDNSILKFNKIDFVTKGSPTNFGADKGFYLNIGSLFTDGSTLDNTTEYKILFKTNQKLDNSLGLISLGANEAVDTKGNPIIIKVK